MLDPASAICDLLKNHPRSDKRFVGLEVERLLLGPKNEVLHYSGAMELLLSTLVAEKKWEVDYESGGHLLGVKKNLHAISLEPGAQFEVSPAPRSSVCEVQKVQEEIDAEILSLSLLRNWKFLEMGVNPFENEDKIELLPSPRYQLMDDHFQRLGKGGRRMMRLTTGLQVNLDFSSEAEAVSMLRASFRVVPVLSAMFANSPYLYKRATGRLSERHFIWRATDPARSGFLGAVFEPNFTLKDYADIISRIPLMYYFDEQGNAIPPEGRAFCDLSPELREVNALACMRQLFSEVRLKPCCVEIRCFDQQVPEYRYAIAALCVGLIYDEGNRALIEKSFGSLSLKALEAWMEDGAKRGLKADGIYPAAMEFLKLAEQGLIRRGYGEEKFLKPVERLLQIALTPAEERLEEWGTELP